MLIIEKKEILNKQLLQHENAVRAIQLPTTQLVAKQMVERAYKDVGIEYEEKDFLLTITSENNLKVFISGICKGFYDTFIGKPESSLDIKDVNYRKCYQMHLVTYNVMLEVHVMFWDRIPEDDIRTLRLLGKVHEELIPAHIETSIYCKV